MTSSLDRDIATRIRIEREERGWSLAELAARSGLGKATISKIERCEASPTAASLGRLSAAFGLTLSTLLARAETEPERLSRRADQQEWRDPATGYVRRAVVAGAWAPFEVTEVVLPAGATVEMPRASYVFIRQAIWLIEGMLDFDEGRTTHRLLAGDSLVLGEPTDCRFRAHPDASCRYLVIVQRG